MIRIGTAGWSYASGKGAWTGMFYPNRKTPDLEFYAHFFDTVEVNSTFYRPLPAATSAAWVERTPAGFLFSVKLFEKFTHPKLFAEATGSETKIEQSDFTRFEEGIAPLAEAGKLGPLLAQFPPSFKRDAETEDFLGDLVRHFAPHHVAIELRHRSWTDAPDALRSLTREGASLVQVDEPKFHTSASSMPAIGPVGYFRFHGRNGQKWWAGDGVERYDYLYSLAEQARLAERVLEVADAAKDTYVTYNNHANAQAVANALQMKLMLGQDVPQDVPQTMLDAYPELARILAQEAIERGSAA